jgi:hypothetical protein
MQSLAFLWFEMQMTQQYLRDKTFGPAESSANSANLNTPIDAGTLRRASVGGVATPTGWRLLQQLDRDLLTLKGSPRGSADMLSVTIFLDYVSRNEKLKYKGNFSGSESKKSSGVSTISFPEPWFG